METLSTTQVCQPQVSKQNRVYQTQVSISLGCMVGITNWNLSLLNSILGWNLSTKKSLHNKITSVKSYSPKKKRVSLFCKRNLYLINIYEEIAIFKI